MPLLIPIASARRLLRKGRNTREGLTASTMLHVMVDTNIITLLMELELILIG